MKTAYDIRQKILLMTIALGISLLLLGLNTCQKAEADMGNTAESADKTTGKVVGDGADDDESATMKVETAVSHGQDMGDTTGQTMRSLFGQVTASKTNECPMRLLNDIEKETSI